MSFSRQQRNFSKRVLKMYAAISSLLKRKYTINVIQRFDLEKGK